MKHLDKNFTVYSDTKRETEINYNRPEDYDLENPFNRIKLIRLARAMKGLQVNPDDPIELRVTICTNRELFEPESETIRYVPFDPKSLEPLEDRINKERKRIDWEDRMNS